ncbi:MAG: hypothetical protein Tsb0013_06600 [Phycisphaerales bacterium]
MDMLPVIAQQGQGFNFGGLLNFLILFLAFGGPAIGYIVKKVKEQAEIKAARDQRRQMERESLRQTQVVERTAPADERAEAADRQRAMRELAMRRQAQLQELRQRQIESARQRQSQQRPDTDDEDDLRRLTGTPAPQVRQTPTASPGGQIPGAPPAGPIITPGARGPARGVPASSSRTPSVLAPTQRRRQPSQPSPPPVGSGTPSARPTQQAGTAQDGPRSPIPLPKTVAARRSGGRLGVRAMFFDDHNKPRSKDDLRRAFALSEIFAKPVSMRPGVGGVGES